MKHKKMLVFLCFVQLLLCCQSVSGQPNKYDIARYNFDPNLAYWRLYTKQYYRHEYMSVQTERGLFEFQAKFCHDAVIGLSNTPGDPVIAFEIVLGNVNIGSYVTDSRSAVILDTNVEVVLNCSEYRNFWIRWKGGQFYVGTGEEIETNTILEWQDADTDIHAVSLATFEHNSGYYQYNADAGRLFTGKTTDSQDFEQLWLGSYARPFLLFQVQACTNAELLLSAEPFSTDNAIHIIIGDETRTKTLIRNGLNGAVMAETDSPDILSCSQMKTFWVSWMNVYIEVGRGGTLGNDRLLYALDERLNTAVMGLSFSSNIGAQAQWQFKAVNSEFLTLFTEPDATLSSNILLPVGEFYAFTVRSCKAAVIAMAQKPADLPTDGYRLEIGANTNTQTILYRQTSSNRTSLKIVETAGVMSCVRHAAFYMEVRTDNIEFGTFDSVGAKVGLLSYSESGALFSTYIALTFTSIDMIDKAEWSLSPRYFSNVELTTPGDWLLDHMWYDVTYSDSIYLLVRACEDAAVYLAQYHGIFDHYGYELLIGIDDDEHVLLRKIGTSLEKTEKMNSKLSCDAWYGFWIQWRMHSSGSVHVAMGEGSVPGDMMLVELVDPNPTPIGVVAVTTDNAITGNWLVSQVPDDVYVLATKPTKDYMYGYFSSVRHYFSFEVQACSDVYLLLHSSPDTSTGTRYEVSLGAGLNRYSLIANLENVAEETQVQTPNLLDCDRLRYFWVYWQDDMIIVGDGDSFTQPIITHMLPEKRLFNFVSLSTGIQVPGKFLMAKYTHGAARLHIEADSLVGRFQQVALASVRTKYLVFSLRSCGGAALSLTSLSGLYASDAYDVILGDEDNTKCKIIWQEDTLKQKTITTPDILDCDHMRDFWVMWEDRVIEVGQGRIPGAEFLMSLALDTKARDIHSIAFTSGPTYSSEWEILDHTNNVFLTRTTGVASLASTSVVTGNERFSFSAMACSDIGLELQQMPGKAYEVRIDDSANGGKSSIMKGGQYMLSVDIPNTLNCLSPKLFWMDWTNRQIRVGEGGYGRNVILEWTDTEEDCFTDQVGSVSMMSRNNKIGDWIVPRMAGNLTHFESRDPSVDYSLFQVTTASLNYLVFRVRVCDRAYLALSAYTAIYTASTYEVVLANGESEIRDAVGGNSLDKRSTTGILDCQFYNPFWIEWDETKIRVGKGVTVGDVQLMSATIEPGFRVNSVSVSVDESEVGYWEFGNRIVPNLYHVHTSLVSGDEYSAMWLSTLSSTAAAFYVKACGEAKVALTYSPLHAAASTYEIILGASSNTESVVNYIDVNGQKSELQTFTTNAILSCDEIREFWVSWANLRLEVGSGPINSKRLFTLTDTMQHVVNAISVSTGSAVTGEWEFVQSDDDYLAFSSHGLYRYIHFSMSVPHMSHLVFKVKACKSVHLLMAATFNNAHTDAYEISIGSEDNKVCTIRDVTEGTVKVQVACQNVLSCTEYRTFWVSWSRGLVSLGAGADVYWNHIADWRDDNPKNIQQVFFDTAELATGEFEILTHDGDVYKLQTIKDHTYDFFWMTPWHTHFTFKVSACNDVFVALTSATDKNTILYEFVLGASGNTQTFIRNESMAYPVAFTESPDILSCSQARSFWVGWRNGIIEVGLGTVPHELRLVHWEDPTPAAVGKLTLSSGWQAEGDWTFSAIQGVDVEVVPQTAPKYGDTWRTVLSHSSYVFRVRAASDAYVTLCTVPRLVDTLCYEVQLGVQGNTKSIINKKNGWVHEKDTPNVLDANTHREFWVSWFDERIMVGTGSHVGEGVLIAKVEDDDWVQVNALGFSAMFGVQADYEFPQQESESTPSPTSSTSSTTSTSATTTTGTTVKSTTTESIGNTDPPPEGLSAGAIVGIIFGGMLGVALAITLFFVLLYRRTGTNPLASRDYDRFGDPDPDFSNNFDNPNYTTMGMADPAEGGGLGAGGGGGGGTGNYGSASEDNPFGL